LQLAREEHVSLFLLSEQLGPQGEHVLKSVGKSPALQSAVASQVIELVTQGVVEERMQKPGFKIQPAVVLAVVQVSFALDVKVDISKVFCVVAQ